MKKNFLYLSALVLSLCTFTACDKDDDNNDNGNRMEIITDDSWVLQSATTQVLGANVDITDDLEACERDNRYDFDDDGTGDVNEGATRCDPSDPQEYSFNWEFRNNQSQIYLSTSVFGSAQTFDIVSLDRNKMVLATDFNLGGINQRITGTFVR